MWLGQKIILSFNIFSYIFVFAELNVCVEQLPNEPFQRILLHMEISTKKICMPTLTLLTLQSLCLVACYCRHLRTFAEMVLENRAGNPVLPSWSTPHSSLVQLRPVATRW